MNPLALAGLISGGVLLVVALTRRFEFRDFDIFHASAELFVAGQNPYSGIGANNTTSPPHWIALTQPIAWASNHTAFWLWTLASLSTFALSCALVIKARGVTVTIGQWAVLLAFVGTFYQLAGGQVAWLLTLPMTLAWLAGPSFRSGVLVGLTASVKPFLGLFAVYFLWRQAWRALAGFVVGISSVAALGVWGLGLPLYQTWLASVPTNKTAHHPANGSIYGLLARIWPSDGVHLFTPTLASSLFWAAALTLLYWTARALSKPSHRDREWAVVLVTALLLSPLGQPYYLFLALGPLWATLRELTWPRWSVGLVGFFWWPNLLTTPEPPTALWQLAPYSLVFVATLTLWLLLVRTGSVTGSDGLPLRATL